MGGDIQQHIGVQRAADFVKRHTDASAQRGLDGEAGGLTMVGVDLPGRWRAQQVGTGLADVSHQLGGQDLVLPLPTVWQAPELRLAVAQLVGSGTRLGLTDLGLPLACPVCEYHHVDGYAGCQAGSDGATAAKNLVIGMRRQHQYPGGRQHGHGREGDHLLLGHGVIRISAARAWACSPSP